MSRPHDLVHPWYRVVRLKCHYVVRLTGARVLEDFFVISNDLASNFQDLVCGFDIFWKNDQLCKQCLYKHKTFWLAHLNLTSRCNLPQVGIVGEGDVVGGVPVQAVAVHVEGHRVQHVVDRSHHLQTINKSKRQLQAASVVTTSDRWVFFRHFQVKLSESRKTELSIKLALPAFSLWCFDDKCTKLKQTGERFEMMLTSFRALTSDKILIATEGVKSYIFPVVPGGTVADRETAWKWIFLYIALPKYKNTLHSKKKYIALSLSYIFCWW